MANEVPLQVLAINYCEQAYMESGMSDATLFCAAAPDTDIPFSFLAAGPCYGTHYVPPRSINMACDLIGSLAHSRNRVLHHRVVR